jgi:hypothetical protein
MERNSWTHWRPAEHSTKEIEHRLTVLEQTTDDHEESHQEHFEEIDRHSDRLNLHERAILALAGGLYILMQDRFPAIAKLIRDLMP